MEAGEYDFSSIIGRVMKQVYERKVKTGNIDGELFRKTYEELNKKAAEGWGEDDYNDPEQAEEPQRIRDNLFKFSGAKTYQEIKEMNDALYDDKGKKLSYEDFREKVTSCLSTGIDEEKPLICSGATLTGRCFPSSYSPVTLSPVKSILSPNA